MQGTDLIDGYRTFRKDIYPRYRELYDQLAKGGQHPSIMVIACADSRVDPATIMAASPGDIFVIRNMGNIVPAYTPAEGVHSTQAALEYAVKVLEVEHIVVMGHGQCGGITALAQHADEQGDTEFIAPWVALAKAARQRVERRYFGKSAGEMQHHLEEENVRLGLDMLTSYPWVRERLSEGRLAVHGWHYAIMDGKLLQLDPETDSFVVVE